MDLGNKLEPIYYNLSQINGYQNLNSIFQSPASIEELNNQLILRNSQDYFVSIVRASLPTSGIPRLIVPIQTGILQIDPNLTLYEIKIKYQTSPNVYNEILTITQPITFISEYNNLSVKAPSENNGQQDFSNSYYWIYDIEFIILMFNNAIQEAWLKFCVGSDLGFLSQYFPYISFDYGNRIFSVNAPASYYDGTTDTFLNYFNNQLFPNVVIQFNALSSDLFQLSGSNEGDGFFNTSIFNKYDNITTITTANTPPQPDNNLIIYKMTASQSSLNMWSAFSKVIFQVNYGISTIQEYDSIPVSQQGTTNPFILNKPIIPMLTDLEVDKDQFSLNNNWLQFTSSSITQSRLISMTGSMLQSFQISVYWLDNFGIRRNLNLPQGQPLTIKLGFFPKTTTLI
jgi:hypothetical protein